jgi:hypothetical protein
VSDTRIPLLEMSRVFVKCSCCGGSGKSPLSDVLQRTLEVVPRNRFISTLEIEQRVADEHIQATAINNRLALWLLPLGLVQRERRGKMLYWKRVA